jgi:hypothetical protein
MAKSNSSDQLLSVYNPKWIQIILYIAILAFPICSLYLFYLSLDAFADHKAHSQYLYLGLALAMTYISYIGLLYFKYVNYKLEFNDYQVRITTNVNTKVYKWGEIKKVRNYPYSQIFILYHRTGKKMYISDHLTPGVKAFASKLQQKTGLTID